MNDSQIITAQVIGGGVKTMESNNQIIPWWSFGKTAIAAATLRLVQDDRLELDASFEGKPYTLRQLLMHTSGLSDYGMLRDYHEAVEHNEHPWDFSDMVERVNVDTLLFEPGKKFSYSNVGYALIRNKIERMTDKNLQKSLEELVFTPLKIKGVTVANNTSDL
ncbi:MAG TPA: serine hydrolase domain-containing protein, partial [Candidatus Andersenbacteria bacterium]|nr:serine hydrolase domain-containing protein [Candidatus Andersenbacteria bacterium]